MKTIIHSGRAKKFLLSVGACALVFFSLSLGWFTPDSMGQQPVITNITIINGHVIIGYSAPEGAVDVERVQPNISREWTTVDSGVMARSWTDNPQDDVVFYRVVAVSTNLSQGDPMDTPLDDTIPDDGTGGDDLTNPADNPDDGTGDNPDDGSGDLPNSGALFENVYGSTPDDEPVASDADNNHASATPDPGRVKIYWHNGNTRYVAAWIMSDTGLLKSYGLSNDGGMTAGWVLSGVGDINRDGIDDLLWYNASSRLVAYWMMEQDGYIGSSGLCNDGGMSAGWTIRAFGDINQDGTADIAWHNTSTRRVAYWFLNQDGTLDTSGFCNDGGMADGWVLSGQGDINNDGTMDLLWHNSSTRRVAYWLMNQDGTLNTAGFCNDGGMAAGWEFRGTGDIRNDGTVAIFWHNSETKRVAFWILDASGALDDFGFCNDGGMADGWILSATGDLNNDGTTDLLWHNSSTRKVAYWLLNNDGTLDSSGFSTELTMTTGWEIQGSGF